MTPILRLIGLLIIVAVIGGVIAYLETFYGGSPQIVSTADGPLAPDIQGGAAWINSPDLSLVDLKGKVVLVDFWTYSCINCIRTLPYLTDWDQKYRDDGLVIIGVHSPEFFFEHDLDNVQAAVTENNIQYPVVLDNNFQTWKAYGNHYWPHKYLIDKDGIIRYDHIGEGGYQETEDKIVELLNEITTVESQASTVQVDPSLGNSVFGVTGEIYAGSLRGVIGNRGGYRLGMFTYEDSGSHTSGALYFEGPWLSDGESMTLQGAGHIAIRYSGAVVNVVLDGIAEGEVLVDSRPLTVAEAGRDIHFENGKSLVQVDEARLYNLVGPGLKPGTHEFLLRSEAGLQVFAFTFGI